MAQVTVQTIRKERAPGGDIPELVKNYVAMHPERFEQQQTHERDVEKVMRMSKSDISREDAEALAWLLWRTRMVRSWSAVNRQPTRTWEEAVESAWLKDELFQMCSERRKHFYEEREARRQRLEQYVKTGLDGDHGDNINAKQEETVIRRAAKDKKKKLEEKQKAERESNLSAPV